MKKALVVGVDYYQTCSNLSGCVNDAHSVKTILERHSDGTKNFDVNLLVASNKDQSITREQLKDSIEELFKDESAIALFYFSGHGYVEDVDGYLISSDCSRGDSGVSLTEVLAYANKSPAKSKIIILDCCHAGYAGRISSSSESTLSSGVTILAASAQEQYALESHGSGIFTNLLVDALNGGAANLLGAITPGSVYAYIDQSLGSWDQRPIFKTNVKQFTSLRNTQPSISLEDLKKITDIFIEPGISFQLAPSFEPDRSFDPDKKLPPPNEDNVEIFKLLQKYNRVNLVKPEGEDHMFYAAINSKSCKLTVLGEHYWKLISKDRI